MSNPPAAEFLPPTAAGRTFDARRTVRLGDVDSGGSLRLDALARYLQDVASDDALDAGLPNALGWLVRRTMIRTTGTAQLGERLTLTTFCTGAGRSWAERRTTVTADGGAVVEAVSLWVQIDVDTGRPTRLGPEFFDVYGAAAGDRTVSSRLRLGRPAPTADRRTWAFRRADLDPFEHVNNAAQWAVAEELLAGRDRPAIVEIEYLAPVGTRPVDLVTSSGAAWLVDGDRTLTALAWGDAPD